MTALLSHGRTFKRACVIFDLYVSNNFMYELELIRLFDDIYTISVLQLMKLGVGDPVNGFVS